MKKKWRAISEALGRIFTPVLQLTLLAAVGDGVTFADFTLLLILVIHFFTIVALFPGVPSFFGHIHLFTYEGKGYGYI